MSLALPDWPCLHMIKKQFLWIAISFFVTDSFFCRMVLYLPFTFHNLLQNCSLFSDKEKDRKLLVTLALYFCVAHEFNAKFVFVIEVNCFHLSCAKWSIHSPVSSHGNQWGVAMKTKHSQFTCRAVISQYLTAKSLIIHDLSFHKLLEKPH